MKKLIALVLSIVLSLSAFQICAVAYPGSGDGSDTPDLDDSYSWRAGSFYSGKGTASDPYIIATGPQLAYLSYIVNNSETINDEYNEGLYFALGANIDITDKNWVPIGVNSPFIGNFNGAGYRIKGLCVTDAYTKAGMFAQVKNSKISKLALIDSKINIKDSTSSEFSVGLLAASARENSEFTDCYITGTVNTMVYRQYVGGIVGKASNCKITNCAFNGSINAVPSSSVAATAPSAIVGGVAGSIYCTQISSCYATGTVAAGGADIYCDLAEVGGLLGVFETPTDDLTDTNRISNSFSAADVFALSAEPTGNGFSGGNVCNSGTIAGIKGDDSIQNCYYANSDGCSIVSGTIAASVGFTDTAYLSEFVLFDMNSVWQLLDGFEYPVLRRIFTCTYTGTHIDSATPVVVTAPKCEETGKSEIHCKYCHTVTGTKVLDATGHTPNKSYTVDFAATTKTDGQKSIHCSVCGKVIKGTELVIPKIELELNVTSKKLARGGYLSIYAAYNGSEALSWSSSNTKVATVTSSGRVKAINYGSCYIFCTTKSGSARVYCKVSVYVPVTSLKYSLSIYKLNKGKSFRPSLKKAPTDTSEKIYYSSSNTKVATVSSTGIVTAKSWGIATITAKSGSVSAKCRITVLVPATKIKINITKKMINYGDKFTIKATTTPTDTTDNVYFSSSKKSVATVDSSGVVTGRSSGSCYIYAKTSSGKYAKCKLTVKKLKISAKKKIVPKYKKFTLKVSGGKITKWYSSNKSVATVSSSGYVKTKKSGKAIITAKDKDGVKVTCTVLVADYTISTSKKKTMSTYYMTDTPSYTKVTSAKCKVYYHTSDLTDEYQYYYKEKQFNKYISYLKSHGYTCTSKSNAINSKYTVYKGGAKTMIILVIGTNISLTTYY